MSGKNNNLVKSTKDLKPIASKSDNNHCDMKMSKTTAERNEELLRKYIYTDVCHQQQKQYSLDNNENDL